MKFYQIAELEQLSGIKAHTIRIWEKRYSLIEPERTETNIRIYNDAQVRKLLNVSTLLNHGFKISRIAALQEKEINSRIREIQEQMSGSSLIHSFINDLTASMLDFNEAAFEATFAAAVTRLGMYEAMLQVFYPFLYKTGLMWITDNAMPVQEHFASSIIRRKLMSATDGLVPPTKKTKTFLLLLPPEEWHEIGLLFANYILRAKSYPTVYLGQNVPFDNVATVLKLTKVTHVLVFVVSRRHEAEMSDLRKNMQIPSNVQLLVAGSPEMLQLIKDDKHTIILNTPTDLLKFT